MRKTFSDKLGYDAKSFFDDCAFFLSTYQIVLEQYYQDGGSFPKAAFDIFDKLVSRRDIICQRLKVNKDNFDNFSDFEIVDKFEEMSSFLDMISNYSRWLTSSVINGRFREKSEIKFVLRQNQTFEQAASEIGFVDSEQGALDITLRNDIKEPDFDWKGGCVFTYSYENEIGFTLKTVVDVLTGDNVLGKDVSTKLEFLNDDLNTLSPSDTFVQTCRILTGLLKNANPEFPEQGFDKSTISNKNLLDNTLPTFIRQMYATVGRDDTIAAFSIENITVENDALRIDMVFRSQLNTETKQIVNGN